jgi:microsomal dipeptidase-like Zn-dependent dipeptidase
MARYFSDLHCHSSLFSYNHLVETAWDEEHELFFHSQGDFAKLGRGRVKLVIVALYPIEQGFITVKPLNLGVGNISSLLAGLVFNMPGPRAEDIQHYDHDYFEDLLKEIEFLAATGDPVVYWNRKGSANAPVFRYRIVKDFIDLKGYLDLDENLDPPIDDGGNIAVVLCIEGAHSLGIGQRNTLFKDEDLLAGKLSVNISRLKRLGPPGKEGDWCPLYITLSHHFWNQLGGHCVSLPGLIRKVLDQDQGLYKGITPLGQMVVEKLLSTEGGQRRILIDINHMSPRMRRWYYRYLASRGENIPVIASHSGVNGRKLLAEAKIKGKPGSHHDLADKLYLESTYFNPWDLLLSDEEIMIIHRSGGIIGLNLDQRIIMGKEKLDRIKLRVKSLPKKEQPDIWVNPMIDQMLHIASVVLDATGDPSVIWDNIAIGSDYSGMITPVNAFRDATNFPDLDQALFKGLQMRAATEAVLSGRNDDELRRITDLILWKNNLRFLERHFN